MGVKLGHSNGGNGMWGGWTGLSWYRWWALANVVMNLQVP